MSGELQSSNCDDFFYRTVNVQRDSDVSTTNVRQVSIRFFHCMTMNTGDQSFVPQSVTTKSYMCVYVRELKVHVSFSDHLLYDYSLYTILPISIKLVIKLPWLLIDRVNDNVIKQKYNKPLSRFLNFENLVLSIPGKKGVFNVFK